MGVVTEAAFTFAFCGLFFLLNKGFRILNANSTVQKQWLLRNTQVSLVHAVVSGALSIKYIFIPIDLYIRESSEALWQCRFSLGYTLYDSIDCFMEYRRDPKQLSLAGLLVHHCFFGMTVVLGVVHRFPVYICLGSICEVNSSFLHARKIMRLHHVKAQNMFYTINNILFFVTCLCFRHLFCFYMGYTLVRLHDKLPFHCVLYFWWDIVFFFGLSSWMAWQILLNEYGIKRRNDNAHSINEVSSHMSNGTKGYKDAMQ